MNTISQDRPTGTATRIWRAIGAATVSTVLIAGLAGCMTGRVAATTENVQQNARVPAGVDMAQPADRLADQVARQNALNRANSIRFEDRLADRVAEELARQGIGVGATDAGRDAPADSHYPRVPADRLEHLLQPQ